MCYYTFDLKCNDELILLDLYFFLSVINFWGIKKFLTTWMVVSSSKLNLVGILEVQK